MANQTTSVEKRTPQQPAQVAWSVPRVDIIETDEKVVLFADMPGASKPDIHIEGDELTIEARTAYSEPEQAEKLYSEFEPRNYSRSFVLSADIERENISAVITNGVLKLEMPKSARAKVHKIEVKSV
jgi:HSP20 family protein